MSHCMQPSARGFRCARAPFLALAAALSLLPVLFAVPAAATEVVQVRVGEHPEFTRVVFELDGRAGYKVERKSGPQGTEFVVTLDAASATRKLARRGSDIAQVEVTGGEHAVARIRLRKGDLALKELILSNPYRIVLDVMRAEPLVAKKPTPAPTQKPVARAQEPKPAPTPVEKPVAKKEAPQPTAEKAAAEKAAAEKVAAEKAAAEKIAAEKAAAEKAAAEKIAAERAAAEKAAAEKVAAERAAAERAAAEKVAAEKAAAEKAAAEKVAAEKAAAEKAAAEKVAAERAAAEKAAAEKIAAERAAAEKVAAERAAAQKAAQAVSPAPATGEAKPSPEPTAAAPTLPTAPTPRPVVKVEKPAPKPAVTPAPTLKKDASAGSRWLNPMLLAGAGGALLCAVAIVFLLRRRRALPNDLDVTAIAEEQVGAADDAGVSTASDEGMHDESSFAGLFDDDETASAPARDVAPARMSSQTASEPAPKGTPLDSLFDDDDAQAIPAHEGAAMSTPTDLPMDRTMGPSRGATPPAARGAAAGGAVSGDVMRLVQELERRIGALESKLDAANEAREKLERQVAAQSEELRVQRAAIARTQRALRTMSRGDDEKATEPALREDTQTKVRPGNL
jgi:hypothetical protein